MDNLDLLQAIFDDYIDGETDDLFAMIDYFIDQDREEIAAHLHNHFFVIHEVTESHDESQKREEKDWTDDLRGLVRYAEGVCNYWHPCQTPIRPTDSGNLDLHTDEILRATEGYETISVSFRGLPAPLFYLVAARLSSVGND